jgi:hypothetical protein
MALHLKMMFGGPAKYPYTVFKTDKMMDELAT